MQQDDTQVTTAPSADAKDTAQPAGAAENAQHDNVADAPTDNSASQDAQNASADDKPKLSAAAKRIMQLNAKYRAEQAARMRLEKEIAELRAQSGMTEDKPAIDQDAIDAAVQRALLAERLNSAKSKYSDWDDAFSVAKDLAMPETHMQAIASSPYAADILYQIGKNPDIGLRIADADYRTALREIVKLEAAIELDRRAGVGNVKTSAPPPIRPMAGQQRPEKSPDEMTYEEYLAWRAKSRKKG